MCLDTEVELKEGIVTKFCKPHPIPFTLHAQVQQQIADGELQLVDQREWATPTYCYM